MQYNLQLSPSHSQSVYNSLRLYRIWLRSICKPVCDMSDQLTASQYTYMTSLYLVELNDLFV